MLGRRASPPAQPARTALASRQPAAAPVRPVGTSAARAPRVDASGFQEVRGRGTQPGVNSPLPPPEAVAEVGAPTTWAEVVARSASAEARDSNAEGGGSPNEGGGGDGGADIDIDDDDNAAEEDEGDETGQQEVDEDDDGDGGGLGGGDEHDGNDEDLRAAWDDAREVCRQLERNPRASPGLVESARAQRDEAEARWRAARPQQPLSKRLRWAEKALTEAVAKQEAHQRELEQFERDVEQKRRTMLERAGVDEARTARKRAALDELRGQGSAPRAASMCEKAARTAATGIATDLGPTLLAAAERLEEGSPAWGELQVAMSTLSDLEHVLRMAFSDGGGGPGSQGQQQQPEQRAHRQLQQLEQPRCQQPAVFDISDGGARGAGGASRLMGTKGGASSTEAAPGTAAGSGEAARSQPPAAAVPRWTGPASGMRWGEQAWKKSRLAGGTAAEAGPGVGADGQQQQRSQPQQPRSPSVSSPPADVSSAQAKAEASRALEEARCRQLQQEEALRMRMEAEKAAAAEAERQAREKQELLARTDPGEMERAAKLHSQQAAIAMAGFGTQQAAEGAGLVQQEQVHLAAQGAAARGVVADADELMAMSPEQLAEWDRGNQGHGGSGQVPW